MDIKQSSAVVGLAVVLSMFGVWVFGIGGSSTETVVREVVKEAQNLGALAGPDIPSPYLQWGGVRTYNYSMAMASASTTCSFRSPAATSTLSFAIAKVNTNVLSTAQFEWGEATTAFATTTTYGITPVASGVNAVIVASTTALNLLPLNPTTVFEPNTYMNLKIGSSTPTGLTGNCYAQFIELI